MIELIPIKERIGENPEFAENPDCTEALQMTIDHYRVVGFAPPWIGYFAYQDGKIVGMAGFVGKPVDNKIEIAYGTIERFRKTGVGTEICRQLVLLAQKNEQDMIITAHTLPEENYSTKILQKNGFKFYGMAWDKDEGNVWEWLFDKQNLQNIQ